MYDGVLFQSPKFKAEGDTEKEHRFCIVVGKLTDDPKIEQFKKTKVSFNLKYYTKQYLNVVLWGDDDASLAARQLEKGDVVICAGTITYTQYTVRSGPDKGKQKIWHDLNCQLVLAQSWINALLEMYLSKNIQKMLKDEAAASFESSGDHPEEYDDDGGETYEGEYVEDGYDEEEYDYELNI